VSDHGRLGCDAVWSRSGVHFHPSLMFHGLQGYEMRTFLRFQVPKAANIRTTAFLDITLYILIEADRRVRGVLCPCHQGDKPCNGGSTHRLNVGLLV
jgi:hypothetical protein